MDKKHLTREEAITAGYEYFVYPADGYQTIKSLKYFREHEIFFNQKPMLCKKEPNYLNVSEKPIKDVVIGYIDELYTEITGNDTTVIFEVLEEIDFSYLVNKINSKLERIDYYHQSDVHLVCNSR